jgi:hypothetical protein
MSQQDKNALFGLAGTAITAVAVVKCFKIFFGRS